MSERVGGPHKSDRVRMWVNPETHAKLLKYVQSKMKSQKGVTMKMVLGMFVDKCVTQDLFDPHWEEKQAAADRVVTAYARSEGECHQLATGKETDGTEVFSCVSFNESGVVRVKKLGGLELQPGKCSACGLDREVKEGLRVRDDRIIELEAKIQMKAKQTNKVPICNGGAILAQEGIAFRSCRKRPGQVNIETFCRKLSANGTLPCALFAEVQLTEGPL